MYCPNCGSENFDGAGFCVSCGARLSPQAAPMGQGFAVAAPGVAQTPSGPVQAPAYDAWAANQQAGARKPRRGRGKTLVACLVTAVVVAAATLGLWALAENTVLKKGWDGDVVVRNVSDDSTYSVPLAIRCFGDVFSLMMNDNSLLYTGQIAGDAGVAGGDNVWTLKNHWTGSTEGLVSQAYVLIPKGATAAEPYGRWGIVRSRVNEGLADGSFSEVLSCTLTLNRDGTGKFERVDGWREDANLEALGFANVLSADYDPYGKHTSDIAELEAKGLEFTWIRDEDGTFNCHVTNYDDSDFTVTFKTDE